MRQVTTRTFPMVRPAIASSLLLLSVCEVVFCASVRSERRLVVESSETAAEAVAAAMPGDVIALEDGAYEGFQLAVEGHGTPEEPITFCAEDPGKVRFTGDVHIDISGEHLIVEGFCFEQAWGQNIIGFKGASHCQLRDCSFADCGDPERASTDHFLSAAVRSR